MKDNEELWKQRFQLFMAVRVAGLMVLAAGAAIAFTDLVRPGGWKFLGGILIVVGAIDAVVAPRVLKRGWERADK
jgi:hypothetical protein